MRDEKGRFVKGHKQSNTGKTHFKQGVNPWNKGLNIYLGGKRFEKGQVAWNKGLKGYHIGEANGMWKGKDVSYVGLHQWVRRGLGKPKKCEHCKSIKNIQWANKSHEYQRDLEDWISLCVKCHKKYDATKL